MNGFDHIYGFLFTEDPNCKIDLVFVVDASGSVRDDWETQLAFVVNVAKKINIGPEGSHIGLVYFGNEATKLFDFTEFEKTPFSEEAIYDQIRNIPRPPAGETTFINRGLRLANRNVLRERFGMRPDVKQVIFFRGRGGGGRGKEDGKGGCVGSSRSGILSCKLSVFQYVNRNSMSLVNSVNAPDSRF